MQVSYAHWDSGDRVVFLALCVAMVSGIMLSLKPFLIQPSTKMAWYACKSVACTDAAA